MCTAAFAAKASKTVKLIFILQIKCNCTDF